MGGDDEDDRLDAPAAAVGVTATAAAAAPVRDGGRCQGALSSRHPAAAGRSSRVSRLLIAWPMACEPSRLSL